MTERIPPGWCWAKVRDVGAVQLGRQRSPDVHRGANMRPYLRVANVYEDRIDLSDVMEMHFEPQEIPRYELKPGDILLNEGQSRELVGRPAMYRGELPGACFTNSLVRFQASDAIDGKFALELFRHWLKSGTFQAIGQITTNIAHLGAGRFGDMDFPVPPLNEQRRIVAKLEALQARSRRAREALDAVPPLLDKLRRSILAAAFRGDLTKDWRAEHKDVEPARKLLQRIRTERRKQWEEVELVRLKTKGKAPIGDEWKARYKEPNAVDESGLAELPEGWCWAGLSEVASLQLGQRRAPEYEGEAHYPYLRAANITWRGLDLTDVKTMGFADPASVSLAPGDVVLSEASGSPTEVGKPALWNGEIENCCFQATVLRVRSHSALVRGQWLHLAFLKNALLGDFAAMAPGIGILHLTAERMRTWPVPLAPVDEQVVLEKTVARLLATQSTADEAIRAVTQRCSEVERATLSKAFRGALVPQDTNDEPADVMLARARSVEGTKVKGAQLGGAEDDWRTSRRARSAKR